MDKKEETPAIFANEYEDGDSIIFAVLGEGKLGLGVATAEDGFPCICFTELDKSKKVGEVVNRSKGFSPDIAILFKTIDGLEVLQEQIHKVRMVLESENDKNTRA